MKRNLKIVALIIIGLALTGAGYTLATDSTASDAKSAAKSTDSTAVRTPKKAESVKAESTKKTEGEVEKDKSSTAKADSSVVDTVTTPSGLKYVITKSGEGPAVKSGQDVAVHYVGRLASTGKEYDNSYKRQRPVEFKLGIEKVFKGLDEGVTGMRVGEERTLIIPPNLAYGKRGYSPLIPPNATLIIDVQLVSIKPAK